MNKRRSILGLCALGVVGLPPAASASGYPSRPIVIVVGFPPGGGADTLVRALLPALSEEFKTPVIVDNRPGAGGAIGTDFVAKAKPDGYTLALASPGAYTIAGSLRKLPYDPVSDFTPIAQLTSYPSFLVSNAASGLTSLDVVLQRAKSKPGSLNYASAGAGTTTHLALAYMAMRMGVALNHIPYKGNPQAMNDLLGGQVDLFVGDPPGLLPHIESGKLIALGVTTGSRSRRYPSIPSIAEIAPGYDVPFWHGLTAPRGLPRDIAARWEEVLSRVLKRADVVERIENAGMGVQFLPATQLATQMAEETRRWSQVIKANNIKE